MRAVVQRVAWARVTVDDQVVGAIGPGFLVLLGIAQGDDAAAAQYLAAKTAHLRLFPDAAGRFQRSLLETGGAALVVSQFTLLGDTRKGRRPNFTGAAPPDLAAALVQTYVDTLTALGVPTATGQFGTHMHVELLNDGPVTVILER